MVIARALRGMNDLFPEDLAIFRKIEQAAHSIFPLYGYYEMRTPILEELALFKRGIGEDSDIVEKEMFIVPDGDNTYCLRPENTAPVVRALIERGGISAETQEKLFYLGPMFRKERPQRGRLRQFHQYGMESFGIADAIADVEIMAMVDHLFNSLALKNIELKINSLGSNDERSVFKTKLRDYLGAKKSELCEDCRRRLDTNPLRVLDCKNPHCQEIVQNAPHSIDSLEKDSREHFEEVLSGLEELGIAYTVDHHLVRGLDYYNRTVFEFVANEGLGAQNTVAAGGRYDGLFLTLGNKIDLPAIGCAGGIERLALLLGNQEKESSSDLCLVSADDEGQDFCRRYAFSLRKMGVAADFSLVKKSIKAQMRRADKIGARFVAVVGQNEISSQRIKLKDMRTAESIELSIAEEGIAEFLKKIP